MHGQKCIACDECCWRRRTANAVSGACSMSGLRTRTRSRNRVIPLQSTRLRSHVHFFPLFFFRDPRSNATGKASSPPQALRGELRTLDRRPNPPSPRYFSPFFSSYPFCYAARPRYSGHFYSLLLPPPPAATLAHLPRFRTYLRDKRLFIAVHRAARVIKSAARGI